MMSLPFGCHSLLEELFKLAPGRGLCATCAGHSENGWVDGYISNDTETSHKSWKRLVGMGLNHVRVWHMCQGDGFVYLRGCELTALGWALSTMSASRLFTPSFFNPLTFTRRYGPLI